MRITIICSDAAHPVGPYLLEWQRKHQGTHTIEIVEKAEAAAGGDILFLIAYHEIVGRRIRDRYRKTLVVHSSDLPEGRGWSPQVWAILAGASSLTVTLLEAADKVDSGPIWRKIKLPLDGHELFDELNAKLFLAWTTLMDMGLEQIDRIVPTPQLPGGATYHRKRSPEDSRLDPDKSLREQFPLLRVADPYRYPAFVEMDGQIYDIILRRRQSIEVVTEPGGRERASEREKK